MKLYKLWEKSATKQPAKERAAEGPKTNKLELFSDIGEFIVNTVDFIADLVSFLD